VGGVSWYEAAAFAEHAGKTLPTVHHWARSSGRGSFYLDEIALASNFGTTGSAPIGRYAAPSPVGVLDMAGNLREWCSNATPSGGRYILGGAWNDPAYVFWEADSSTSFDRDTRNGFRCVRLATPLAPALASAVTSFLRDYDKDTPVSDAVFEAIRGHYAYDHRPLGAAVDSAITRRAGWRDETVTFDAGYGGQRMVAHVLLPTAAEPPYQVVLYYPGDSAFRTPWEHFNTMYYVDFILRSGRAVVYPLFKGMHERKAEWPLGERSLAYRDRVVEWRKELGRALDYIESREDLDSQRVAYFGFSRGAILGPVFTALEPRFKASVLLAGGFPGIDRPREIDELNFVGRVRVPTLMLHGRYDAGRPLRTHAVPMFARLGTPSQDKRLAVLESGHVPPLQDITRETVQWLDRHLRPPRKQ
jgi:dienelactone hydrolase